MSAEILLPNFAPFHSLDEFFNGAILWRILCISLVSVLFGTCSCIQLLQKFAINLQITIKMKCLSTLILIGTLGGCRRNLRITLQSTIHVPVRYIYTPNTCNRVIRTNNWTWLILHLTTLPLETLTNSILTTNQADRSSLEPKTLFSTALCSTDWRLWARMWMLWWT